MASTFRYTDFKELLDELRIVKEIKKRNIQRETIFLVPGKQHLLMIPKKYRTLCKVVSQKKFLSIIPNKNVSYLAVIEKKRGLMNSAYFVETVTNYLLEQYKDRFCVIENEAIKKLSLQKTEVILSGVKNIWKVRHVVLCTNGYKGFKLEDNSSKDLDRVYRDKIEGLTGFMIGYEYPPFSKKTHTFGIHDLHLTLPKNDLKRDLLDFSYLYLSERPYQNKMLMIVGGIESLKTEEMLPKNFIKRSSAAYQSLDHIVKNNLSYTFIPKKPIYAWQGLMGYTKNLVRIVGKDPIHDRLFYNIGCNGIGILPSIASGERISKMILGERIKKTIFDTE
jgi:glycine/D-amino acid oxidase-like deaminating enzyme